MKWNGIVAGLGLAVAAVLWGCAQHHMGSSAGRVFHEESSQAVQSEFGGDADEYWILPTESGAMPPQGTNPPYPSTIREPDARAWAELRARRAALADGLALDELPGNGGLVAQAPTTGRRVVLPLEHTRVEGSIAGSLGDVSVTQRFTNPYDTKIEAVYVFPLPENGAVRDFLMKIGDRTIRGVVREREEAQRIYERAKGAGKVAALLTEERPNVFTQRVANLEPGKTIDVTLRYLHGLRWIDGAFEFTFPMVVGPRYDRSGSTSGIGAVTAGQSGTSGHPVEVPYLRHDERSGHDVSLRVRVESGFADAAIESPTHAVRFGNEGKVVEVELDPRDRIPNKDFVLRLRPAGNGPRASFVAAGSGSERFFQLTLVPPADLASIPRSPIEAVFVVDCSGSMQGAPLETVKRALHAALGALQPGDAFQFVQFSVEASTLGTQPIPADAGGIQLGRRWIEALTADGGTEVLAGVRAALDLERDPSRERIVSFLTDGYIANEDEVLRAIRAKRGDVRVFGFGIGSAPNRFLLEELALEGHGAAAWLREDGDTKRTIERFLERASRPAMTDPELDFGRFRVRDVMPSTLPDLLLGRTVVITGRIEGGDELDGSNVVVRGRAAGRNRELVVPARSLDGEARKEAFATLWARARIADLAWKARGASSDDERRLLATEVRRTALEYGLLSAYTAFLAVDSLSQTSGTHGYTVPVAVPHLAGMRYETGR